MKNMMTGRSGAKILVLLLGFALSLYCQSGVTASTFSYDFEGLTNGPLAGRDGWKPYLTHWFDCVVTNGPAGSGNTSKVLRGQPVTDTAGVACLLPGPVALGPSNPVAEIRFMAYGNGTSAYAVAGPTVNDNFLPVAGLNVSNSQLRTYLRQANYTHNFGDVLTMQHWYEFKLVMDFSTAGGKGTLSYRDVTAGQVAFTSDSTFQNFPLGASASNVGDYWIDSFYCRLPQNSTSACIDNLAFEAASVANSYTAVSDSFNDGNRNDGADALDVKWISVQTNTLTLTVTNDLVIGSGNALFLDTGSNDPCVIVGSATRAAFLGAHVRDRVRLSLDLRLNTINMEASNMKLRAGLYKRDDFDASADNNATNTYNDSGYYFGMSVYTNKGTDIAGDTNGNDPLAGGTGYVALTTVSGASPFSGFNDTASKHTVMLEIVRRAEGVNGMVRLYGYIDGVLVSIRQHDTPFAQAFDEIAIRAVWSSSGNVNQDFTVDNVVLESIPHISATLLYFR